MGRGGEDEESGMGMKGREARALSVHRGRRGVKTLTGAVVRPLLRSFKAGLPRVLALAVKSRTSSVICCPKQIRCSAVWGKRPRRPVC